MSLSPYFFPPTLTTVDCLMPSSENPIIMLGITSAEVRIPLFCGPNTLVRIILLTIPIHAAKPLLVKK